MGAYGAPGGVMNGPDGYLTQHPEVLPVTIGGPGASVTVTTQAGLQALLPQGGTPSVLLPGDRIIAGAADIPEGGVGGGVLTSQTLALTLSVRFSSLGILPTGLASFELVGARFCTQDNGSNEGPFNFPPGIAIGNNTVQDLLLLANQGLRGATLPDGFTLSSLNEALDTVNEAFDECRRVVACD
jgi:hypothetical protein